MGNRTRNKNRPNKDGAQTMSEAAKRFERLLRAMATQPEPSEKPAKDSQTSDKASGAGYGDTRIRHANSAL